MAGGRTARSGAGSCAPPTPSPRCSPCPGPRPRPADLGTLTVDAEVASVVADIEAGAGGGSITLVAHSSGGLVVPGVTAALGGRVQAIVLNAALVPAEGGCGIDCMQERHRDGLRFAVESAAR